MPPRSRSKRRLRLQRSCGFFIFIFLLILYLRPRRIPNKWPASGCSQSDASCKHNRERSAYITLLCDDVTATATAVLVHSVKKRDNFRDFIVLTMNTSHETVRELELVGAKVITIQKPVKFPFRVTEDRLAINKPCRYSKLLIWNMVEYDKLVYLDSDMLVLENIDELFDLPSLSATPDLLPPDKFNSGLMVIQPDQAIFSDMMNKVAHTPSPNIGDQGFLNNYYSDWYSQDKNHSIPVFYNSLVRSSLSPVWNHFVAPRAKILHFSGSGKPWNRMTDSQFPSNEKFNKQWLQMHEEVQAKLQAGSQPGSGNSSLVPIPASPKICHRQFMAYQRGESMADKLSVVINSFDRFTMLKYMVRRYAAMDFVHKVYIVWGNTGVPPFPVSFFNASAPVEIVYTGLDNLNDRFLPIQSLETEALLICDDDLQVDEAALRTAFHRWQESKYRLVGFFPRGHYVDRETEELVYVLRTKRFYSMVLTKVMIMHGDYLQLYSCTLPPSVRHHVDRIKNCEDILMNMMVTHLSGLPPLLLLDRTKIDYGTTSGLSFRDSHDDSRSKCMNDIVQHLGYLSLKNTSEVVVHYSPVRGQLAYSRPPKLRFQPVMDVDQQFMDVLPFADNGYGMEIASLSGHQESILCVKGRTFNASAMVELHALASLNHLEEYPPWLVHGTTVIVYPVEAFTDRFDFLRLVATLYQWRLEHGCFAPSNVLLVGSDLSLAAMQSWNSDMVQGAVGGHLQVKLMYSHRPPECLEQAFVVRRSSRPADSCHPAMNHVRHALLESCRNILGGGSPFPASSGEVAVHVAFLGNASTWEDGKVFQYSLLEPKIKEMCRRGGVQCNTSLVGGGSFCEGQVLAVSRADVAVGFWGDPMMNNFLFLKPGSLLIEIVPFSLEQQQSKAAEAEASCLGLQYEQVENEEGPDMLLLHVQKRLKEKVRLKVVERSHGNVCPHFAVSQ